MQRNREFVDEGLVRFALQGPPEGAELLLKSSRGDAVLQEVWSGSHLTRQGEPFDPRATVRLTISLPAADPAAPRLIPFESQRLRGVLIQLQGVARVGDTHLVFLSFAEPKVRYLTLQRDAYGGDGTGTLLIERTVTGGVLTCSIIGEGPHPTAEGMLTAVEELLCGGGR